MLDGMHEGLLILNKHAKNAAKSVAFCNKPAQRLIGSFVGSDILENKTTGFSRISTLSCFVPLKTNDAKNGSFSFCEAVSLE